MTHYVFGLLMVVVLLAGVKPGWGQQQYLYTPKAVDAADKVQKKDGILVEEILIKKGDTLYDLSRKFSGHGFYYPQILLFNNIKNPNLIYTGKSLKVPVSRAEAAEQVSRHGRRKKVVKIPSAAPVRKSSAGGLKKGAAAEGKKAVAMPTEAAKPIAQAKPVPRPAADGAAASEQMQFEQAMKAYRKDEYRTALRLFDRFLAEHPSSPLAADASLYKAECYLKQSNQ